VHKRHIITEIIDWFWLDETFSNENNDEVDVTVKVNENAVLCWALQYGPVPFKNPIGSTIHVLP